MKEGRLRGASPYADQQSGGHHDFAVCTLALCAELVRPANGAVATAATIASSTIVMRR